MISRFPSLAGQYPYLSVGRRHPASFSTVPRATAGNVVQNGCMASAEKPDLRKLRSEFLRLLFSWWFAAYFAIALVFGGFLYSFVYIYYWSLSSLSGFVLSWIAALSGPAGICFMLWGIFNQMRIKRAGLKPRTHPLAPWVIMIAALTAGTVPASIALILNSIYASPSARPMVLRNLQTHLYRFEPR